MKNSWQNWPPTKRLQKEFYAQLACQIAIEQCKVLTPENFRTAFKNFQHGVVNAPMENPHPLV